MMKADVLLKNLGLAVRKRREATGISQEKFADRIGSNRAYYGDIERGKRNLTIRSLHRIAEGLSTTVPELLRETAAYEALDIKVRSRKRKSR